MGDCGPRPFEGVTLKIFPEKTNTDARRASISLNRHYGVICDVCKGPVAGRRYKCIECPDFDLCQVCGDQNKHPQHNMVTIQNPRLSLKLEVS